MSTVYFTEIDGDEPLEALHDGEEVEQLAPVEMPVHVLTADQTGTNQATPTVRELPASSTADPVVPVPEQAVSAAEEARLRGNAAFASKQYQQAVSAYSEAIQLDEENALMFGNRCAALLALGRKDEALVDAKQMVALSPALPKAHFRLGSVRAALGRPAEAAAAFAEALRLEPSNDAVAEALKREMANANIKKDKRHASLLQVCQQALAANKSAGKAVNEAAPATSQAQPRKTVSWAVHHSGSEAPSKRGGCTLTAVAGRLWLVGGADRTGEVYDDIWEFRAQGSADSGWHRAKLRPGAAFGPRSGHAAVGVDDKLLVFGGQDPRSSKIHDELLQFEIPAAVESTGLDIACSVVETSGTSVGARNGHSMTYAGTFNSVYIFGGANEEEHLADLRVLQLDAGMVWSTPECQGKPPAPREMHAAGLANPTHLLLHGGRGGDAIFDDMHLLALETMSWSGSLASPVPRVGHSCAVVGSAPMQTLIFFGGFNGSSFCSDSWQALKDGDELVRLQATGETPPKRFAHCCAALGHSLYVFGGSAKTGELSDVAIADTSQLFA
ncbi:hypothetical protein AB1Y20_009691 [Prymnesium parvum]|uniref:Uncharacterized protein n=1 Tax=Prymnesium parvum TaxID=97485 RepID=A0AB34K4M3_PRYPA